MLSQTCKIAIKAVIYLSLRDHTDPKSGVKEIALGINASEHTVGKTLQRLVKNGIINSSKGPSGGFYLDEKQRNQPIYNIVEAIEGKGIFRECGLGLNACSESHPCPIHHEYKEAREMIEKVFRENRIGDLRGPVDEGLAFLTD